jgi:hypothetical protein|tara:strand:+ start:168 stop:398 length:231 start_codon:yes stop_codon:yes gene_type:complete
MLIDAQTSYLVGGINKHKANIEVYMNNTVGIGEHSDIMETIDLELEKLSAYHDKLEMLVKYFPKTTESNDAKKQSK